MASPAAPRPIKALAAGPRPGQERRLKLRYPSALFCRASFSLLLAGCGSGSDSSRTEAGSGATGQAGMAALGGSSGSTGGGTSAAAVGGAGSSQSGSAGAPVSANQSTSVSPPVSGGQSGSASAAQAGVGGSRTPSAGQGGSAGAAVGDIELGKFSFFVSSYAAMQRLSGSKEGFGGDLRFGQADGLSGADEICRQIAEASMKGSGSKGWRAFLSVTKGPDGKPVNAIDRVGNGPWYDRLGRLVAQNKANLGQTRPAGADPAIINDLPNEDGVPNHAPEGATQVDNHDILTGSSATGTLYGTDWSSTCHDWTSSTGADGRPRVGHSWPRMGGSGPRGPSGGGAENWMSALDEAGCAPGASLIEMGPPNPDIPTVGSGGGYGGIYCFALKP